MNLNKDKYARLTLGCATILFLLFAACSPARAQLTTGDILGTVTDPSEAIIAGAQVTVENQATHLRRTGISSASGDYVFNLLEPGTYSVTVVASGFKKFSAPSVSLVAADRVRVDAQMAVGGVDQTVTVESTGSALQTDSSNMTASIAQQETQDLPLNGRDFAQLLQLVPGADEGPPTGYTSGGTDDQRQTASISVNGQSEDYNSIMIDGADNYEKEIGTPAVRPSIDSVAEMSMQSLNYTADAGRTGGAVVNVITKSGTNQFHGDVFEFVRNTIFDANNYNFGAVLPKSTYHLNQFGGSLGGPIVRDKAFFFGSYEGYRLVQGAPPTINVVPTFYEEQNPGNFSDSGGPVICSSPGVPVGCTGQIDPIALDYFKMYPAPNVGTNEYVAPAPKIQNSNIYDARVDHSFNSNNTMYARFIYNFVYTDLPGSMPDATVAGIKLNPNHSSYSNDQDYDALLNYIHTFNPNLLLELKASYTRANNQSFPLTEGQNPNSAFGQPNINTNYDNTDATGLMIVQITGGTTLGQTYVLPIHDQDNTYQYLGAITYTHGRHNIKLGATVIRRQLTAFQSVSPEGEFTFNSYPLLLEGLFNTNGGRTLDLFPPHLRTWEPAGYVQDDWHILRNLTLNLGVRYDLYTPYTETHDHISTWDPDTQSLWIAGQNGISDTAGVATDYQGLAPRLGFSYDAGHNWVVRGGFGIGYFPMNIASVSDMKNPPFVAVFNACGSPGQGNGTVCPTGYTQFYEGLPASSITTPGNINNPSSQIFDALDPHFKTSYLEQYNLTVQKELAGNVATFSYVGLLGRQLDVAIPDLNTPPPNNCNTSANTNPNCYQELRPYYAKYPNLGVVGDFETGAISSYNALQVSLERRMKNGLSVNVNYSWSHNLDDNTGRSEGMSGGSGMVPSEIRQLDYGNSDLDNPQRFAATGLYQLPFGNNARGAVGYLVKGWQANVIQVWGSGTPFTVLNYINLSDTATAKDDRPNQTGRPKLNNLTRAGFFNSGTQGGLSVQAPGTLGNERHNQFFGPHWRHTDMSLFKVFPVKERLNVEFRAESYNIANTTNFSTPGTTLPHNFNPASAASDTDNYGVITATQANYIPRVYQFSLKATF